MYFLKAIPEGIAGFGYSAFASLYTFLKYAKL
jgi:hypothetical protein